MGIKVQEEAMIIIIPIGEHLSHEGGGEGGGGRSWWNNKESYY